MKTHQDLLKHYENVQARMDKAMARFPWEDRRAYLQWLRQSYEYVKNSTRILALTAGHLSKTEYSSRFIQHAAEEKGHDKLLVNDAKSLGTRIEEVPVFAEAKAFHQSLYYSILYDNPMAIFGWVIMLEGIAHRNGEYIFKRVIKAHGEKTASFLKVHSNEDIEHIAKALETLSKITDEERAVVIDALEMYADLYCNVLERVESECLPELQRKAA